MTAALLEGRRGLILGVSSESSVAYACARAARAMGAEVAITYRPARRDACEELARAAGITAHFGVDPDDEPALRRAASVLAETWGRLDFMVHCWVTSDFRPLSRPLLELSPEDFEGAISATAYSFIRACRCALPLLERSSSPRVVTMTSEGARKALPDYHAVGVGKAALEGLVRYLAYELGPRGVLCNAVRFPLLPTAGATAFMGAARVEAYLSYVKKRSPLRAAVEMSHVTQAVAFLSSALCERMTGQIIDVDSGMSVQGA